MDPTAPCNSEDSCRQLGGTEGLFAGASTLELLAPNAIPTSEWSGLEHYGSLVEAGIDLLYDPMAGDCGTYACSITTSIAPFKKLGGLILISTAYVRSGDAAQMRALFEQVRELATQQRWPFLERFEDMVARVEGTGPFAGKGLLSQWRDNNKRLGLIQLPLSPSTGVSSCSTCHFAGEMRNPKIYER